MGENDTVNVYFSVLNHSSLKISIVFALGINRLTHIWHGQVLPLGRNNPIKISALAAPGIVGSCKLGGGILREWSFKAVQGEGVRIDLDGVLPCLTLVYVKRIDLDGVSYLGYLQPV